MRFKKRYGQHFLKFVPNSFKRLVKGFTLLQNHALILIETGPGGGILTYYVLDILKNKVQSFLKNNNINNIDNTNKTTNRYIVPRIFYRAVEVDKDLTFSIKSNELIDFQVIYNDILQVSISDLILQIIQQNNLWTSDKINVFLFGALPYNISKKIVLKQAYEFCLLNQELNSLCSGNDKKSVKYNVYNNFNISSLDGTFWYMLQKEVADSFLAVPPNATFISNSLRLYTKDLQLGEVLPSNKFYPKPKVESASIFGKYNKPVNSAKCHNCGQRQKIINFMHKFFIYRRKTIRKILRILRVKNIDKVINHLKGHLYILNKRPQELQIKDWQTLYDIIKGYR